ncbi:MAG: exosortase/archaeosortase family protein [Gemmataceae bacterium]|nr:exosortase/archaeosortase family protein [Gemmataceae bacterium]
MNLSALSPRVLALLGILGWVYWPTMRELYETWTTSPEYSHGLLVPFFAAYLLLKRKPANAVGQPWPILGFSTLLLAIGMRLIGSATSFLPIEGLSLVLCVASLVMIAGGKAGVARFWPPIVFLLFMIPLPYEASRMLGAELQKIATIASTFLLQCFGQPAIAEGNRILVRDVTLNVVEACSGLRMLMTFAAFSVAAAFVMERHWIVKGLVLASTVPIALLTNVLRIVVTGLAHVWLQDSASKGKVLDFIHDFNGWMMMPVGLTFLLLELWVLKHLLIEKSAVVRPQTPVRSKPATPAAVKTTIKPRFASVIRMP